MRMVDTEPRRQAAELIEKFRDGLISNFDFEDSWPRADRRDRAMKAISTMLWRTYSDVQEHRLIEEGHLLTSEQREIFNRCWTNLEYQWAEDSFIGIGGLGAFGRIFTLGLSALVEGTLRRREERRLTALHVIGEEATWPFLTADEYQLHQSGRTG
jgi:hypothetical protein